MKTQFYSLNTTSLSIEDFGEETVMVNFDTGKYYGLSGSGRVLVHSLARSCSRDDLVRQLGRHFEPGEHGNLYEFRTYTYGAGAIPKVIEAWAPRIEARTAISPLVFAGYTEIGPLNQWVHVWAYKNMADRETRRAQAMKPGVWPPPRHESVVLHKQTSTFAVPASWSPLR